VISIVFSNEKGGAGKSGSSHLLALGCAHFEQAAYVLHSDKGAVPPAEDRPYWIVDAKDPAKCKAAFNKLVSQPGNHWVIVDLPGNEVELDKWIAPVVSMVVLPTNLEEGFVSRTLAHFDMLMKEKGNCWILPRVTGTLNADEAKQLERITATGRALPTVKHVKKVYKLNETTDQYTTPETVVNNAAKQVYRTINNHISRQLISEG